VLGGRDDVLLGKFLTEEMGRKDRYNATVRSLVDGTMTKACRSNQHNKRSDDPSPFIKLSELETPTPCL